MQQELSGSLHFGTNRSVFVEAFQWDAVQVARRPRTAVCLSDPLITSSYFANEFRESAQSGYQVPATSTRVPPTHMHPTPAESRSVDHVFEAPVNAYGMAPHPWRSQAKACPRPEMPVSGLTKNPPIRKQTQQRLKGVSKVKPGTSSEGSIHLSKAASMPQCTSEAYTIYNDTYHEDQEIFHSA